MKFRYMTLLILFLIILAVTTVSASDVDNTTIQVTGEIIPTDGVIGQDLEVNNVVNESVGSFTDLQNLVNDNCVVNLTKDYTLVGSERSIHINGNIIINGNGHTINGNDKKGIFEIREGNIYLNDIVFKNGKTSEGGAIYVSKANSILTLNNVTFLNNDANSFTGGAIFSKGNVKIYNSKFLDNFAYECGGAISVQGHLEINNALFKSNRVNSAYGGAIYSLNPLNIINSSFIENFADESGGAIYAEDSIFIKNCTFESNKADDYCGGAIYAAKPDSGAKIEIIDSIFNGNSADNKGGAIYTFNTLDIKNSTFLYNVADGIVPIGENNVGGAIYTINSMKIIDSTFIGNHANDNGGAIYCDGTITLQNSKFISNKVDDYYGGAILNHGENFSVIDSEFIDNSANVDGGAIWSKKSVSVINSIFKNNQASGASIFQSCGGAIRSEKDVKVDNCTFFNNHAADYGGAIYSNTITWVDSLSYFIENYVEDNAGGAIYTNRFTTDVSHAVFIGNGVKGDDDGGAIYINNENHITFTYCTFNDNYAGDEGGAIYLDSTSSDLTLKDYNSFVNNYAGDEGQDIFNKGTYGEIKNNWWGTASPDFSRGQLIEWKKWTSNIKHSDSNPLNGPYDNSTKSVENTFQNVGLDSVKIKNQDACYNVIQGIEELYDNNVKSNELNNDTLKVSNDEILTARNNIWYVNGSKISSGDGKSPETGFVTLKEAIDSSVNGDTIYIASGVYTGNNNTNLTFSKNLNFIKYGDGEAIFSAVYLVFQIRIWTTTASINITGLTFKKGSGYGDGGAIYSEGNVYVTNSTFIENLIHGNGGAIYCKNTVIVKNSIFKNNNAISKCNLFEFGAPDTGWGGAIWANHVEVDNSTFFDNYADTGGGAIYTHTLSWMDSPSYFIKNNVYGDGAAIYTDKFETDVKYGFFLNNDAFKGDGGAIYINKENHVTFSCCNFNGNGAYDEGGAIYLDSYSSHLSLKDSILIGNLANDKGQIVYNCGNYGEIKNNWYGTNKTDFKDRFKECHWYGDEDHVDSNLALVPLSLDYFNVDLKFLLRLK